MKSSLIGKVEKASRYAEQPERVTFLNFSARFQGDHGTHAVAYQDGIWQCSCRFFADWEVCSHMMALQKLLVAMLPLEEPTLEMSSPQRVLWNS